MSPFSVPASTASTSATRTPEATAAAGLAAGSAAPGQAVWLGKCGQTADCYQIVAGDSKGRSPADETAEGSSTPTTTPHRHQPDP